MRDISVRAASRLAFRTKAPGEDLKELATPRIKQHEFQRLTRAATIGEIRQDTDCTSFVKQGASICNMLPAKVHETRWHAAKTAIAKAANLVIT